MSNSINFDPNYVANSHTAEQKIKLVFGLWKYRYEAIIDVNVNYYGLNVIDWAVEKLFDEIIGDNDYATLIMTDVEGNELETSDDEDDRYEWLKSMLISAEILSFKKGKSI